MKRFILSTIGTSILTAHITPQERERGWYATMRDTANLKADALPAEAKIILDTLAFRALDALCKNDVRANRRMSAELNGIYGIYNDQLDKAHQDMHYLISTDTAQGETTARLIQEFLHENGVNTQIFTPDGLSTQDTKAFSTGTKALMKWCEDTLPGYRDSGYQITFNLVGGFKSLQGYMNTIGMFYADEIVYIFEAVTADLIRIPRLPIQMDTNVLKAHVLKFALMAAGKLYPIDSIADIPETLLETDGTYTTLSDWGLLVWNRAKAELLKDKLLDFPWLSYLPSFVKDFTNRNVDEQVVLQEKLAEVSGILDQNHGDTTPLKAHPGLQYENYTQNKGLAHFRTSRGMRISYSAGKHGLTLRRYGREPEVNANP